MQFSLQGLMGYFGGLWAKFSKPQKIVLIVAPLVVAVALISLIMWANRPNYVPLFTSLNDTEAGAITQKLQELKVNYQLGDNGSTILVPQQQAATTRLDLANAGLPQGSKFSFDYLNQMQLGETDADRKLRYILGLQDEMQTTLKAMAGVQDARVSITMPDPSLYTDSQQPATASVTLKLIPGTKLGQDQVRAIANLLAASAEGLKPENVTIVDTNGNLLSDLLNQQNSPQELSGTQLQLQQSVEDSLNKSVQTMLESVLGTGKIVVRSNVNLDFDQVKISQQKNGPGTVLSKQASAETDTAGSSVTPGGVSTGQNYVTPTNPSGGGVTSSSSITENYQVDTYNEERVVNPGAIKRLSVSVIADSNKMSSAQLSQIKNLVASAVGYDQTRGDDIQVVAMPFDKSGQQAESAAMAAAAKKQTILTYIELGAGILLVLLLALFVILRWRRRADIFDAGFEPVPIAAAKDLLNDLPEPLTVGSISLENGEKQKIKETLDKFTRNNPDEVAKLVKTWLAEER